MPLSRRIERTQWQAFFDEFSCTQAADAAPLILMASNGAGAKDRELWKNDYGTNQKADEKIEELERQIKAIAQGNHELLRLRVEQSDCAKSARAGHIRSSVDGSTS